MCLSTWEMAGFISPKETQTQGLKCSGVEVEYNRPKFTSTAYFINDIFWGDISLPPRKTLATV